MRQWLRQVFCWLLRRHDSVLHFEGGRVLMRCTSCGHESPGWETCARPPRVRFDGDPRRHLLTRQLRLVARARRSA